MNSQSSRSSGSAHEQESDKENNRFSYCSEEDLIEDQNKEERSILTLMTLGLRFTRLKGRWSPMSF